MEANYTDSHDREVELRLGLHEIHNGLAGILVYTEMLMNHQDFPERLRSWAEEMRGGATDAVVVVQRLERLLHSESREPFGQERTP